MMHGLHVQDLADFTADGFLRERFSQKTRRTGFCCLGLKVGVFTAGNHYNGNLRVFGVQMFQHIKPIAIRQVVVKANDVRVVKRNRFNDASTMCQVANHLIVFAQEKRSQHTAEGGCIIDNQNGRGFHPDHYRNKSIETTVSVRPSSTVRGQKQRFSEGAPRSHAGFQSFFVKVL